MATTATLLPYSLASPSYLSYNSLCRISRRVADLPVPAQPVRKMFFPRRTRSMACCCSVLGTKVTSGGFGGRLMPAPLRDLLLDLRRPVVPDGRLRLQKLVPVEEPSPVAAGAVVAGSWGDRPGHDLAGAIGGTSERRGAEWSKQLRLCVANCTGVGATGRRWAPRRPLQLLGCVK